MAARKSRARAEQQDKPTLAGADLTEVKKKIQSLVAHVGAETEKKKLIAEGIQAAFDTMAAIGVPKKSSRLVLQLINMTPEELEAFDMGYTIMREALNVTLPARLFDLTGKPTPEAIAHQSRTHLEGQLRVRDGDKAADDAFVADVCDKAKAGDDKCKLILQAAELRADEFEGVCAALGITLPPLTPALTEEGSAADAAGTVLERIAQGPGGRKTVEMPASLRRTPPAGQEKPPINGG